jgi:hypothetical protein
MPRKERPVKLPNADKAVIEIAKLRDYCLNPDHYRGRHKARVFASALALTADDSEELRDAVLEAILTGDTVAGESDQFGQRYAVDFAMARADHIATVRSTWIIRTGEDFPRLTSCFVV